MTDLPINISSTPAKAAASKPSGNDDIAQPDAQGFGNMLARQVADSARPAEPSPTPSGDTARQASEQDNAATAPPVIASSPPADMLAALLAQQNPAVTPRPELGTQAVLNTQIAASASVLDTALPKAEGTIKSGNGFVDTFNPNNPLEPDPLQLPLDKGRAHSASPLTRGGWEGFEPNEQSGFNAAAMKELSPSGSSPSLRGSVIGELATSAQQPALPPLLPAAAAPSSPVSINTPVTQAAWGDEFSQKITWIATQRNQTAELHLNPPQLGPLDVVLKISGDQASAIFTSPHAAVRDAIEQALPKLREMLADNGIMLGNATVNDQATKNGQDSASRKPQGGTQSPGLEGATELAGIQEAHISGISRHNGMVDTFA